MGARYLGFLFSYLLWFCLSASAQGVLTTLAGTDWLFPADGQPAINAPLSGTSGLDVVTDRNGNYYIADEGNVMVFRVGADGIVSVIAGNGIEFFSGDGGLAVNASLLTPISVAVDRAGNVYVGEFARIRKVTPDGIITTIAGTGATGFSGDGGPATQAQLHGPYGLAVDSVGNIYLADTLNRRIRKITPDGIINTIAGGGTNSNDGVPATSAQLTTPVRLALDSAENLYISDNQHNRIQKLDSRGILTTVAGGGTLPGEGVPATSVAILPAGLAVDTAGNLYIADGFGDAIRKVDTHGVMTTVAGNGSQGFSGDGGPAVNASFDFGPFASLAVDPSGNIYVADDVNSRIRRFTAGGQIGTVAGNGLFRLSGNGGPGPSATLDSPTGIIEDKAGNIYFTEPFLNRIRRIAPDGAISVFAGTGTEGYSGDGGLATAANIAYPEYLTIAPDGSIVFSDSLNCVIRAIDKNGIISTYAGSGFCRLTPDPQPAANATFLGPEGLDFDSFGDLLIADTYNNLIRALITQGPQAGNVFTVAGTGVAGYTGDGGLSNAARLDQPSGVRVHGNGVYFCDTNNNVVRYVDFSSFLISTVAGNGHADFSGDGGPATSASLNSPSGIVFDAAGNMYIADNGNSLIRKVDVNGTISTFAGRFGTSDPGDGESPRSGFIGGPTDLFFRANGDLIFTDLYFNRIREIQTAAPTFQTDVPGFAFTSAAGSAPLDQGINVSGSTPGIPFTASTGSTPWLSVSVTSGRMPANLRVRVDPSALTAGSYNGAVTISVPNAKVPVINVPVSLTVTAAGQPSLSVSPGSLTFPFVLGAASRNRSISVSNTGGGSLSFTATAGTNSGGNWLQVTPGGATLNAFASLPIGITADPANLAPGTYSGTVTVASANASQRIVVPVTMTITTVLQTIQIPQTGLSFFTVQGGGPPAPQIFNILNAGMGQMPWRVTASTLAGGSWLSVFPQSGQTDAASAIVPQVRVDVNPQGLGAGTYYATVQVSAQGATNDPQVLSVILTVLPPGSNLGPIVQPAGMIFSAVAGGESPGSQTVTLQSTSNTPVNFTSGRVTADGKTWFQSLPPAGTITQSQPARVVIQPDTRGLAPGIYRGSLTVSFSDGNTRNVALVLVVIAPGSGAAGSQGKLTVRSVQDSCKPTTLAPVFTSLSDGSAIPAGYPGQVTVKVIDDCANPMTAGVVTTTFSNGDPPLGLTSLKDGTWVATWVPRRVSSEILITAGAEIREQNLKGQAQIKVGSQNADPLPVIAPDGVVSAASFAAQLPLAPGGLVALFGSKLAQGSAAATAVPLPLNLAGSSILLGGKQAPLFYASDGQVNAVIPYGIATNAAQQVLVLRGTSISVPQAVTVAPAAPAVFTLDGKQGIVVDVDSAGNQTLVDLTHPAKAGDALVIYCTGLGDVNPPVIAGNPAPLTTLSTTVNPVTVTIGGMDAKVLFAGLTPSQVGLYQVNAVIPSGIAAGTQIPLVLSAAGQFSVPVTISVQ